MRGMTDREQGSDESDDWDLEDEESEEELSSEDDKHLNSSKLERPRLAEGASKAKEKASKAQDSALYGSVAEEVRREQAAIELRKAAGCRDQAPCHIAREHEVPGCRAPAPEGCATEARTTCRKAI